MRLVESDYKGDADELIIKPLGDLHFGSKTFLDHILKDELKAIDRFRDRTRIILMGDLCENATKHSVGAGWSEQKLTPDEQIDLAVSTFAPYVDLIDGGVIGNHEVRTMNEVGTDIMKRVFAELGIAHKYLGYQGLVKHSWNGRAYLTNVWHGSGGGASGLNKILKQRQYVFADLYLMGHVHQREATYKDFIMPNYKHNTTKIIQQGFVITGSSLGYEHSYAEMTGLSPGTAGFPTIYFSGERKGNVREKKMRIEI